MLDRLAAQELVDGLSAIALGASVLVVARRASPLRAQLGFALGGLCLFFAMRAAAGACGSHVLNLATLEIVGVLPLAALLLAEAMLRRHAPRMLKVLAALGAAAMPAALIVTDGRAPMSSWGLGGYVIASLAGVTILLVTRDRASLSRQENASVDLLMASGVLLTLLSLTDFLPQAPVGLSGVGAASIAFAIGAHPGAGQPVKRVVIQVLATGLAAAACALAFAHPLGLTTPVGQVRLGAILLALLLSAGVVLTLYQRETVGVEGFASALARADTSSLDGFLETLASQPLLAGLRLAEGPLLADYDAAGLGVALASRAVWTRAALSEPWRDADPRARDELDDLMARTDATHAVMVSPAPLRIALLTLPGVGPADDAETDLALFHKLAVLAAQERP